MQLDRARSISREALASLPIRRYEGRIVLAETRAEVDEARADFADERLVGLDTETRPAFRKGESYLPSLVQVATARAVYLFPLRNRDAFRSEEHTSELQSLRHLVWRLML